MLHDACFTYQVYMKIRIFGVLLLRCLTVIVSSVDVAAFLGVQFRYVIFQLVV